ncbi:hypothetical protein [Chengkuizengella marina]|uniref:Uncharacterized protein n=1 Tax=Chengkuizengella marina TaxID=2507566 RepID=A0A6N9Q0I2_9BACL|nr:hypothetical protein [Chengkuizengella marina]NBI28632.1 hypothetical protein [Chengkuizengella marina]
MNKIIVRVKNIPTEEKETKPNMLLNELILKTQQIIELKQNVEQLEKENEALKQTVKIFAR